MAHYGNLTAQVAERIRAALPDYHDGVLPVLSDLCRTFDASRSTVRAALAFLEGEGLVKTRRGRRAEIPGQISKPIARPPKKTFSQGVYAFIVSCIADGTYPAGLPLPKTSVLGKEARVSTRTMARVMDRLTREGLVHRFGRVYQVGPRIEKPSNIRVAWHSVLAVITQKPYRWKGLGDSDRTKPFVDAFMSEAKRNGIRLVNVVAKDSNRLSSSVEMPVGITGLQDVIRKAQSQYVGALLVTSAFDLPGLDSWLRHLLPFGRPAAWFNRSDETPVKPPQSPLFTTCRYNEAGMAKAAVDFLHARGHRFVFYPYRLENWQKNRGEYLSAFGAKKSPPLRVEKLWVENPNLWQNPEQSGMIKNLAIALERIPELAHSHQQFTRLWQKKKKDYQGFASPNRFPAIFEYSNFTRGKGQAPDPSLDELAKPLWTAMEIAPVLQSGGATALIATNDGFVNIYLRWARQFGLSIPNDFSVLSFDNIFAASLQWVTSVDPGLAELGYQAFHSILRDIPTRRKRNGVIDARPEVVDGGQVGFA